ncbi:MAG TPA: hypothetical protein VLA19_17245 [Herpetosiphonaceae bacterium]|nr:hypothetical protein [Herpetosiphonaceae bacterium]
MTLVNTIAAVKELLALSKEIAAVEGVSEREAQRRALAELPRLANDAQRDVRYAPSKPRRVVLSEMRWRPVEAGGRKG